MLLNAFFRLSALFFVRLLIIILAAFIWLSAKINDGTTPLQEGQTVAAQLSGRTLLKDTPPPELAYQWTTSSIQQ